MKVNTREQRKNNKGIQTDVRTGKNNRPDVPDHGRRQA